MNDTQELNKIPTINLNKEENNVVPQKQKQGKGKNSKRKRRIGIVGVNLTKSPILKTKNAFEGNSIKTKSLPIKDSSYQESKTNGHAVNGFLPAEDKKNKIEKKTVLGGQDKPLNTVNNVPERHKDKLSKPLILLKSLFSKSSSGEKEKSELKLKRRNSIEDFGHISFLTPAWILQPSLHGENDFTKKFSSSLGENFQLKLAAAHINDAINGYGKFGEARAIFKSEFLQKCFRVICSRVWAWVLYLTIAVHCLLLFWEQPFKPTAIGQRWTIGYIHTAVLISNAICLFIYLIDFILHTLFLTWRNIWGAKENIWIRVEFILVVLFFVDFIVLIAEAVTLVRLLCPFRCLRASMLLCKSKNVAHIFNVLISIITKLGKVFLIILIFIVTFASIGLHLFMVDYHSLSQTCYNETTRWNCTNIYSGAFDQVASASLHMFVLMSTENYPEFIIPAFVKNWANFFYFGLYLYAGVFFLTAILLAIIVESYWDYSKRHVKEERRRQREELVKAWNLMDPLGSGQLSVSDPLLKKLFHILKPNNSAEENDELINYLSMYGDGLIDSFDWTTKLIDALSFEFEEENKADDFESRPTRFAWFHRLRRVSKKIVHGKVISVSVLVLILIHSLLFCLMWVGISEVTQLAIQSCKTFIVVLFILEMLLRAIADGKMLCNVFDVLDMAMVGIAAVGYIAWYILWFKTPRATPIELGACAVISGLSILIRAVFNSQHARVAVGVLQNIYPVMFDLILLVFSIIFFYAVIGLEIFQNDTLEVSSAQGYEGSYVEYGCGVGFETFACALLTVFQIVTTNDWHEIMLGAMLDTGWPAVFYFVSCYLIVDMIVMNLFVAITIEAYKKLAQDNEPLNNNEQDENKMETSFTSAAKHTLNEIFASSRKSASVSTAGTLTGYAGTPNQVRRGTLGSLGLRTPTPGFEIDEPMRQRSRTNSLHSQRMNKTPTPSPSPVPEIPENGDVDRREKTLKQRYEQRRKERRKTKQEEKNLILAQEQKEKQLKIEDVVQLKKAVKVIKSFTARHSHEMSLHPGETIPVTKESKEMYLGPSGWFPVEHVVAVAEKNNLQKSRKPSVVITVEPDETESHHVKFKEPNLRATRMKKKTDRSDWRTTIHGDITVMNKDEMNYFRSKISGGLERRHLRSVPSQLTLKTDEPLLEADEEVAELPRVTISESPYPSKKDAERRSSDTHTLTLPQPPHRGTKKKKEVGEGGIPDWMQKFVEEKKVLVDKDVKLDDNGAKKTEDKNFPTIIVHHGGVSDEST